MDEMCLFGDGFFLEPGRACGIGGCKREAAPGRRCCGRHLEMNRQSAKRRLGQRRASGTCLKCPRPPVAGKTLCELHLQTLNEYQVKRYALKKEHGVCVMCKEPAANDGVYCEKHRAKQYGRARARFDERHRLGLCYNCQHPVKPGCYFCQRHMDEQRERKAKARALSLAHYSPGPNGPCCACCGETCERCLQIDHIDGSGGEHRRSDRTAREMASWLVRHNFPAGFQVLCGKCNHGRWLNGGACPCHIRANRPTIDLSPGPLTFCG